MPIRKRAGSVWPAHDTDGACLRGISCKSTPSIFRDCNYGSRYYWRCRLGCIGPVLASEYMGLIWKC
jgi:hypothetical protein